MGLLDLIPRATRANAEPVAEPAKPITEPPPELADGNEPEIVEVEASPVTPGFADISTTIDIEPETAFEAVYAAIKANPIAHGIRRREFETRFEYECAIEDAASKAVAEGIAARIREALGIEWCERAARVRCLACKTDDALDVEFRSDGVVMGRCARHCEGRRIRRSIEFRWAVIDHDRRAGIVENMRAAASAAALASAGEQRWVIPGFLGADMLTLIGGTSGDGKTYELLHAALCVACGIPWFGRSVTRGPVLLALLEGAAADRRTRILRLVRGFDPALASVDDERLLRELGGRLHLYPHELKTDDAASLAAFSAYVDAVKPVMVGIDNLSEIRTTAGHGAENDTAVMTSVLKPLADLAHSRPVSVVVLHHSNARGELRGSSAIRQHADVVFELERESSSNEAPVTITRTKDRTGDTLDALTYRMVDDDAAGKERRRVVPELATTAKSQEPGELSPRRTAILEIVRASPGIGITEVGRALNERTGKTVSMRDVTADVTALVDAKRLQKDADKKYSLLEDR